MVCWAKGRDSEEIAGEIYARSLFLVFFFVFLCSLNSSCWWRGMPVWHLWIGRARHPGLGAVGFAVWMAYAWRFDLGYGG